MANDEAAGMGPAAGPGMDKAELEGLRYPVGRFEPVADPSPEQREAWMEVIAALPERLRSVVSGLTDEQLDTPYRPGGWTVRQLVHHVADSHVNSYVRFGLALAEEGRRVGLYDEKAWAEQPFARTGPLEPSLALLEGLHARWVGMLRMLDAPAFRRTIDHPDWGQIAVDDLLALYAWHCRHHVAHVRALREREGWGLPD